MICTFCGASRSTAHCPGCKMQDSAELARDRSEAMQAGRTLRSDMTQDDKLAEVEKALVGGR